MPNYDFTSPLFLTVLIIHFVSFSIRAYDVGILHSIREGNIVRPLGSWVGIAHWIGWGTAIALLILNWKYALIIFVIRFFLRFFSILQIIGFLFLYPFLTKVPKGVSHEHLEVAKAMFIVCNESIFSTILETETPVYTNSKANQSDSHAKFEYARKKFEKLELNENTLESIIKALNYLRASDFVKSEAREFYQYEKERREREQKRLKEEKEWEEKMQQWEEEKRQSDKEFEERLKEYRESENLSSEN